MSQPAEIAAIASWNCFLSIQQLASALSFRHVKVRDGWTGPTDLGGCFSKAQQRHYPKEIVLSWFAPVELWGNGSGRIAAGEWPNGLFQQFLPQFLFHSSSARPDLHISRKCYMHRRLPYVQNTFGLAPKALAMLLVQRWCWQTSPNPSYSDQWGLLPRRRKAFIQIRQTNLH